MPVALPANRLLCLGCQKRKLSGQPMRIYCGPCLNKNPEYYPDNSEAFERISEKIDRLRIEKNGGIAKKLGGNKKWHKKSGVAGLTPMQREEFEKRLHRYREQAIARGRNTKTGWDKPLVLNALRWTLTPFTAESKFKLISTRRKITWYWATRRRKFARKMAAEQKPAVSFVSRTKQTL